jgi:hypothetical protein
MLAEPNRTSRDERQQDRVVQHVDRPHAAGDTAHDGAGEAVGMPVGGEALHTPEGFLGRLTHHPRADPDQTEEEEIAADNLGDTQGGHRDDRGNPGVVTGAPIRIGDGVDEATRIDRYRQVGSGGEQDGDDCCADHPGLTAP